MAEHPERKAAVLVGIDPCRGKLISHPEEHTHLTWNGHELGPFDVSKMRRLVRRLHPDTRQMWATNH